MQAFFETIQKIIESSGFARIAAEPLYLVMIVVACVLLYLAIVREFEPLLLLPIAFGMLLANLPGSGIIHMEYFLAPAGADPSAYPMFSEILHKGGLADMLYLGVKLGIYPPLIFLGIGTMTDFGPLISNPKSLLLGAAAQLGIFTTYLGARWLGFTGPEASAIGIIGGADGPTAIFVTSKLAPHLLGSIAVAAYSYMALVPVIQPPIMKVLTTKKERQVVMKQLRTVSKTEKIIFPIMCTIIISLILPDSAILIGMLMLGNLMKESGVVDRINKTAGNELMNIITIFLGLSVGCTTSANTFLTQQTVFIVFLGLIAFCFGTAGGVLLGKLMCFLTHGQVNPLIGSAGVSAVPMAARVSQKVGQKENPQNFLLMHAMGPNVAGVIGSAVAAGILINLFS
ncbi:MAG TPA: sodium ion-translocating decarboxylase subunit beta [Candidatus Anaerofilum faecale]|nr:sodium ion-translocating decarboxylase subunit beta [Anaerofilum sp. An201]OUP05448.1 glutaconyl-CoA decarboxylase subunit beta [Anaerofilum sp. An201]HIX13903.1 sodium ion-translocating decarboxylase subunit beta [Candidatus Anaerofilum faecale]